MRIFFLLLQLCICNLAFSQEVADSIKIEKISREINEVNFSTSYSYKTVPKFIKKAINKAQERKFTAASKGCKFNSTDVNIKKRLSNNRILYIAYSDKFYIITFEHGGYGINIQSKIVKFNYKIVVTIINLTTPFHENISEFKNILMNDKRVRVNK